MIWRIAGAVANVNVDLSIHGPNEAPIKRRPTLRRFRTLLADGADSDGDVDHLECVRHPHPLSRRT